MISRRQRCGVGVCSVLVALFAGSGAVVAGPMMVGSQGWVPPPPPAGNDSGWRGQAFRSAQPWRQASPYPMHGYRWRPGVGDRVAAMPYRVISPPLRPHQFARHAIPWQGYRPPPQLAGRPASPVTRPGPFPRQLAWLPPPAYRGVPRAAGVPPQPVAWGGTGRPTIVTVGGQPYRFRPVMRQLETRWATFAPPLQPRPLFPQYAPPFPKAAGHGGSWAATGAGPVGGHHAWQPAGAPWVQEQRVYRFRPDARFPQGGATYAPAGPTIGQAYIGPPAEAAYARAGQPFGTGIRPVQHRWDGYVYN